MERIKQGHKVIRHGSFQIGTVTSVDTDADKYIVEWEDGRIQSYSFYEIRRFDPKVSERKRQINRAKRFISEMWVTILMLMLSALMYAYTIYRHVIGEDITVAFATILIVTAMVTINRANQQETKQD